MRVARGTCAGVGARAGRHASATLSATGAGSAACWDGCCAACRARHAVCGWSPASPAGRAIRIAPGRFGAARLRSRALRAGACPGAPTLAPRHARAPGHAHGRAGARARSRCARSPRRTLAQAGAGTCARARARERGVCVWALGYACGLCSRGGLDAPVDLASQGRGRERDAAALGALGLVKAQADHDLPLRQVGGSLRVHAAGLRKGRS